MDKEIKFEFVKRITESENFKKEDYYYLPIRATRAAAGYDFICPEMVTIAPGEIKIVKTGVKAKFPEDLQLKLYNRSSNAKKKGLILANGVGIVDADYYNNPDNEGEIGFMFWNITDKYVSIDAGDKLGQGIFEKYYTVTDESIEGLATRMGGWGSTGK